MASVRRSTVAWVCICMVVIATMASATIDRKDPRLEAGVSSAERLQIHDSQPSGTTFELEKPIRTTEGTTFFADWLKGKHTKPKPEWRNHPRPFKRNCKDDFR